MLIPTAYQFNISVINRQYPNTSKLIPTVYQFNISVINSVSSAKM